VVPSKLIPAADRERIEAAVREAESGTSGEIVVSVVRDCSRHGAAPWRMGVALAALALLGSAFLPIDGTLLELFALQVVALIAAHLLCRFDSVRRVFVSESEFQNKVELAALRAFNEHGISQTEERTGILIFVALLEHRVVVLGDEAIDRALDPNESWEDVVALVLGGLREGHAANGIIQAIRCCGEILSHPLPARPDDRDELPQGLILSD
jgi:putative membrane protein